MVSKNNEMNTKDKRGVSRFEERRGATVVSTNNEMDRKKKRGV